MPRRILSIRPSVRPRLLFLLQLEASDFAHRWEMLGNSAGGEECEVRLGTAVTAARWAEIRAMVLSGVKMGEWGGRGRGCSFVSVPWSSDH